MLNLTERLMLSPDGAACDWCDSLMIANRPNWIDCTGMNDEEFQQFADRLDVVSRSTATVH